MKISQRFKLNKTQAELDFVDIDTNKDKELYLDPFFIATRSNHLCIEATKTIKSFFGAIIDLIREDRINEARVLFSHLNEPDETCLGMSIKNPQGTGVNGNTADKIFSNIVDSRAVTTGLVDDLEDTAIFIDDIGPDRVSDMTTNIIRKLLLKYTKDQCELLDIDLIPNQSSGYFWETSTNTWEIDYTDRLVINGKPILLVPKIFVSFHKNFSAQKYLQHDALNFLKNDHLNRDSSLVQIRTLRSGEIIKKPPTKTQIREAEVKTFETEKSFLRDFTIKHKDIFSEFKKNRDKSANPISNEDLDISINEKDIASYLIDEIKKIPTGNNDAHRYHKMMYGILEFVFFPNLTNPVKEKEINDGRKRVDILMDNSARNGFFYWVHDTLKIPAPYIYVECKNYKHDPENPEYDQLSGRLSINRGNCGLLIFRIADNTSKLIKKSIDYYKDKRELIIPIYDDVIIDLLNKISNGKRQDIDKYLFDVAREIIPS